MIRVNKFIAAVVLSVLIFLATLSGIRGDFFAPSTFRKTHNYHSYQITKVELKAIRDLSATTSATGKPFKVIYLTHEAPSLTGVYWKVHIHDTDHNVISYTKVFKEQSGTRLPESDLNTYEIGIKRIDYLLSHFPAASDFIFIPQSSAEYPNCISYTIEALNGDQKIIPVLNDALILNPCPPAVAYE